MVLGEEVGAGPAAPGPGAQVDLQVRQLERAQGAPHGYLD